MRQANDLIRKFFDSKFVGIPQVDWPMTGREKHSHQTFNEVRDIAKTSRLIAIAVNGDVFVLQSLHAEVRHYTTIINPHTWTIGVENAHNLGVETVHPMVGHRERFQVALRFVIAPAGTNRIHIPPIAFGLRMLQGFAVYVGSLGHQHWALLFQGDLQNVLAANSSHT